MNKLPNKIGIIGGVGPQSTNFIYKKIVEYSQIKFGAKNNNEFPFLIIESVPVPDFIGNKKHIAQARKMLIASAQTLEAAGAARLAIGSNTVHILLSELEKQVSIPFISVIAEVGKKVVAKKLKKIGLLGSPVLVKSGLYEKVLRKFGIDLILPDTKQLQTLELIIRDVLAGNANSQLKKEYVSLLHDLYDEGAENIILGCTELPQAINYEALDGKTIDSDQVLAEAIADYYYSTV